MMFLSKVLGLWVFVVSAWIVTTGFFLLFPMRLRNSLQFYKVLFPDRSRFYHLWCAWRQFHSFSNVFLDRFLLQEFDDIIYTSKGWEHIEQTLQKGRGGIILMSHVGNWEVAAHLLKHKHQGLKLLLYMGIKDWEQIERIQKESISKNGIKIIAVDQRGGSPWQIVEGIKFINSGGLVSLTGDLIWKQGQRTIPVKFLGHTVILPETPHLLALLSGAPLFIFFAFRAGKKHYHVSVSEPLHFGNVSREERTEAIRKSAQGYADILEENLRRYPFQWYHFRRFLGSKQEPPDSPGEGSGPA
jgi:predicted LPLAT superfamily acyltransferase